MYGKIASGVILGLAALGSTYLMVSSCEANARQDYLRRHPEVASEACAIFTQQDFTDIIGQKPVLPSMDQDPSLCTYDLILVRPAVQIELQCGDDATQSERQLKQSGVVRFGHGAPHGTLMTSAGNGIGQVFVMMKLDQIPVVIKVNYGVDGDKTRVGQIIKRAYMAEQSRRRCPVGTSQD